MVQLNFEDMFDSYVASNQKTWAHDRSKTIGASEMFACIRKVGLDKRAEEFGYEVDEGHEDNWGAMERGNLIEDHWVVPVLDHALPQGVGFLFAGDDQKTFIDGIVSATPDGLLVDLKKDALAHYGIDDIKSDCVGFEIKSIDPRVTLSDAKLIHSGQAQMQMDLVRKNTEFKPNFTIILYVDASFLNDMKVFIVEYDPNIPKAGRQRAEKIFNVESLAELQPEGKLGNDCQYCKWRYACADISGDAIPTETKAHDVDPELMDRIADLVDKERQAAEYEKGAKEDKELLRANIKQALIEADVRILGDERFKVTWTMQKGRTTFDKAAAIAAGLELDGFSKTGPGFEKMTIKKL